MKMSLSILIVNWNTGGLISKCVESILEHPPDFDYEIIVVDNASTDGSADNLDGKVKLIRSEKNLGFAAGNNLAYRHSLGEYILLLNPDTEMRSGGLGRLGDYLDEQPEVGIVGPKLLNPDGSVQPSVRRFPDVWSSVLVFAGLHKIIRPKKYLMDGFDYTKEQEVDQVMGAALMTRREVIEKAGGLFDEQFFLWYEEVDFCQRVKRASLKVMYYPKAVIMHHTARSFQQLKVYERKKTVARSLVYYFRKHGRIWEIWVIRAALPVILAIAWVVSFLGIKKKINV